MIRASRSDVLGFVVAVSACLAGGLASRADFAGVYRGTVVITNGVTPSPPAPATTEIVPRSQFPGTYLVTLRDGQFNPSMITAEISGGAFLSGADTLPNNIQRSLNAGFGGAGNTLFLQICLSQDHQPNQCDVREFAFEGVFAPFGACILPPVESCVQMQALFCGLAGGSYLGDGASCAAAGACLVNGVCSIRTQTGCDTLGGDFDGEGSHCPTSATIHWVSEAGGSYSTAAHWNPARVPVHNAQRSDIAVFDSATVLAIPIQANLATAWQWRVTGNQILLSGDAHLFATDRDSLMIEGGLGPGELHVFSPGLLATESCLIGGGGAGEALLRVAEAGASWDCFSQTQIGGQSPGRVEVANGTVDSGSVFVGGLAGATGTVDIHGAGASWTADDFLVGNPVQRGDLQVSVGGVLRSNGEAVVDGPAGDAGNATLQGVGVDSVRSAWVHTGTLVVGNEGTGTVRIEDGAILGVTELKIGNQASSVGDVRVRGVAANLQKALLNAGALRIGHNAGIGRLEVLDGAGGTAAAGDIGCNGNGSVLVSGSSTPNDLSDLSKFAAIEFENGLAVGCGLGGGQGLLTVLSGGGAEARVVSVTGSGAGGRGQIIVDGGGGRARLNAEDTLIVDAMEVIEVQASGGGEIKVQELTIGRNAVRPGAADVNLSGGSSASPPVPTLLHVRSDPNDGTPAGLATVGGTAPGQLKVELGAVAQFDGGLRVGQGAQGIVIVSNLSTPQGQSTLTVNGETQVGIGAAGIMQLGDSARMVANGDVKIGMGPGTPSGSITVNAASFLAITGALSLGEAGQGRLRVLSDSDVALTGRMSVGTASPGTLEVLGSSDVSCDVLSIGGNTAQASGNVDWQSGFLTVRGDGQVGSGLGSGSITLHDAGSKLIVGGTLTVGNPSGGSGGGTVALIGGARIEGGGSMTINPNGHLLGTGIVALCSACTVDAGGEISPSISFMPQPALRSSDRTLGGGGDVAGVLPGTLIIEADYSQQSTGVLIVNHAGSNPGEFDRLVVTGTATLGGRLEVHFRGGFSPDDPEGFVHSQDFVEAGGGVIGDYDERVFVFPDEFADFDDDGDKDLSDLAAFQNCLGLSGSELEPACSRADWEADGVIGNREVRELSARIVGPQ